MSKKPFDSNGDQITLKRITISKEKDAYLHAAKSHMTMTNQLLQNSFPVFHFIQIMNLNVNNEYNYIRYYTFCITNTLFLCFDS